MSRDVHFAGNEQWNWEELTKVNQISNAPNNFFGSMLEESEDKRLEESEDEQQDASVDDAPVRGGAFSDQEKQNLRVG